jgi:hypothetical protein
VCASSAREHQCGDEAGGDHRDLQIQRKREIGGGTKELRKCSSGYPACRAVRRFIALNGDAVGRQPDAKPQAMFLIADPAADRLESFLAPGTRYPREKSLDAKPPHAARSRRAPLAQRSHPLSKMIGQKT